MKANYNKLWKILIDKKIEVFKKIKLEDEISNIASSLK